METTIKIHVSELTENGRHYLAASRGSSPHLATILADRNGVIYADLADSDDSDDVVEVAVRSAISYRERALMFGMSGLELSRSTGQMGRDGHPIPTEQHLDNLIRMYGEEDLNRSASRLFTVPVHLLREVQEGALSGTDAWNAIADEFDAFLELGRFEPAISSEWITQTEAAEAVGTPLSTIRTAVNKGRLITWEDYREPNPQRRTRVLRSAVRQIWG